MLLLKYSFTGLLPTSVLESFWRLISTHLTWISCGDWIDHRRHSNTLSFLLPISSFFSYLKFKSSCSKTTWVFFTSKLVIAAWLIDSIEVFSAQIDKLKGVIQTLAAWLTNFLDIFCAAHILPYDLQTESNFYDLTHFASNFCWNKCAVLTDALLWLISKFACSAGFPVHLIFVVSVLLALCYY